ncbi:MAG: UDP-N-acetylmuramate dehydrogenase [Firmicutes bacterium]|nr:UDP-N-acetylmuramate dehydrogenase [Bacillota bacterium]
MTIIEHADMRKYTSFKAGGTAKKLVIVESVEELLILLREIKEGDEPYIFMGNGTNTLFLDGEYDGTVIKAGGGFENIEVAQFGVITAGSAVLLSKLARTAAANRLTGLEFAAGIPGSVGGGVFMNAGAYDGEIKDILVSVKTIAEEEGKFIVKTIPAEELELSYRHSKIMENGGIILSATFALSEGNKEEIEAKMKDFADRRSSKQPLEYPSAGSFFKRPAGDFAGRLIEQSGLAGFTVGGAQISEKHCGFVINTGDATASDIVGLMYAVQDKVCEKFGVKLEPEVRFIGEI